MTIPNEIRSRFSTWRDGQLAAELEELRLLLEEGGNGVELSAGLVYDRLLMTGQSDIFEGGIEALIAAVADITHNADILS